MFALNGTEAGPRRRLDVRSGERIRLRLINSATARLFLLEFLGHNPMVVAYDGQAVEPHAVPQGLLPLGPGMRVDLVLDCTGEPGQSFAFIDRRDKGYQLATIVYAKQAALRSRPLADPIQIAPNNLPEPDPAKATEHFIVFEGGLLGKPAVGIVDGKPTQLTQTQRSAAPLAAPHLRRSDDAQQRLAPGPQRTRIDRRRAQPLGGQADPACARQVRARRLRGGGQLRRVALHGGPRTASARSAAVATRRRCERQRSAGIAA